MGERRRQFTSADHDVSAFDYTPAFLEYGERRPRKIGAGCRHDPRGWRDAPRERPLIVGTQLVRFERRFA